MESIQYIWKDRKRILGMPITFTRYRLSKDRLFCEKGFLNIKQDEVLLYRVRDLQLNMSLGQRIFGVGTICVVSSDKSVPHLDLISVKVACHHAVAACSLEHICYELCSDGNSRLVLAVLSCPSIIRHYCNNLVS
mgnify:CR=1 FL=1